METSNGHYYLKDRQILTHLYRQHSWVELLNVGRIASVLALLVLLFFVYSDYHIRQMPQWSQARILPILLFFGFFVASTIARKKNMFPWLITLYYIAWLSLMGMAYVIAAMGWHSPHSYLLPTLIFFISISVYLGMRGPVWVLALIYGLPGFLFLSYAYVKIPDILHVLPMNYAAIIAFTIAYHFNEKKRRQAFLNQKILDKRNRELKQSETSKKILLDNLPDQVWYLTDETTYGEVNQAHARFKGLDQAEMAFKSFYDLYPEALVNEWRQSNAAVFLRKKTMHSTNWVNNASGEPRLISISKIPVTDVRGEVAYVVCFARDVTEQQKAEQAKMAVEKSYRDIFNSSSDALFVHDIDTGRILDVNQGMLNLYGYTHKQEVFHCSFADLSAPTDENIEKTTLEIIQTAIQKQTHSFEWRARKKSGEVFQAHVSLSKIQIKGKDRLLASVRDITRHKQAEEALKSSELRFKNILQNVETVAVQGYSMDGIVSYWNRASESFYGYSREEALGQNVVDLIIPMEKRNSVQNEIRLMRQTGKAIPSSEYTLMRKDGSPITVFSSHSYVEVPGKDAEFFCIDIDLSDRKKTEKELQASESRASMQRKAISELLLNQVVAKGDTTTALQRLVSLISDTLSVARASVWMLSEGGDELQCVALYDAQTQKHSSGEVLKVNEISAYFNALQSENRLYMENAQNDPRTEELVESYLKPLGITSILDGGIFTEGRLMGVICCEHIGPIRKWFPDEGTFITATAAIVAQLFINSKKIRAEQALTKTNKMLELIMNSIPQFIFWKDRNSVFIGCNHNGARVAGLNHPREIVGKTDYDLAWKKEEADYFRECDERVMQTGQPEYHIIEPQRQADGKNAWLDTNKMPLFDENGKVTGVLVTFEDITQRRQTELELRKLSQALEQSPATVMITNLEGTIEYVNPRFTEVTGYTLKEAQGQNPRILKSNQLPQKLYKDLWATITEGKVWKGELLNKKKDGTLYWEAASISPIRNEDGTTTHFVAVKEDITYQKQAEKTRQQLEVAQKTARFKQNFLANMSHEIRTPLTGVLGMIDILEQTCKSPDQKDYIQILMSSGIQLKEIIDQVLDFSKIEAGKTHINPSVFAYHELPMTAELLYKNNLKPGVKLQSETDPKIPPYLKADKYRLSQVLNNFVSNAAKFTHQGSIRIISRLISINQASGQTVIKIEVTDTGIGIPDHLKKKLFVPFSQIEEDDTRSYEGTGLGLAISKELIQLMGGETGVISVEGKGSTFWFTFPAVISQPPPARETATRQAPKSPKLHILLAEDKAINQKVVTLMLTSLGHTLKIAQNGKEVLTKYQPGKFDLILMDIQMPVMDGVAATQKLKQKYDNLPPIVGLSANAFEGDREKYMALGMDEYLTKPVKKGDFENLIEKLFRESPNPQGG